MWKYGLSLILVSIILAGCKESPEISYTAPVVSEEWVIRMNQSGGIMGMHQTIEADSNGNFLVVDLRTQQTASGTLKESELVRLRELAANMKFTPPKIPAVCADCFVYEIEIESGGRKMIVKADDVSLGDSGLGELVQFLRNIMDRALR